MKRESFTTPYWLRLTGIVLGIAGLIWLSIEDQHEYLALLCAALLCIWFAVRYYYLQSWTFRHNNATDINPRQGQYPLEGRYMWVAVIAGTAVSPLAILLMLLKIGIHDHPTPAYTYAQIYATALRIPFWVIGATLIGLSISLWHKTGRSGK